MRRWIGTAGKLDEALVSQVLVREGEQARVPCLIDSCSHPLRSHTIDEKSSTYIIDIQLGL
jgi:hypothetical protein